MRTRVSSLAWFVIITTALAGLHGSYIGLPYYWDEAGYYIPAAWDIYAGWKFIPESTLPTGHPPLLMTYLALAWHVFGFSTHVTRSALLVIAAGTVLATSRLAQQVVPREAAVWSALLLAVSPLFFAQSTLVFLDLPAALLTTLSLTALLRGRPGWFALAASLAVLSKETAIVLLPVIWLYAWREARNTDGLALEQHKDRGRPLSHPISRWLPLLIPIVPLLAWTLYYHHRTGYWTGNAEYLQYNLYTTLDPVRVFWSVVRRLHQAFMAGFVWILTLGAMAGWYWGRHHNRNNAAGAAFRKFSWVALGLIATYIVMLSMVGGAVLPRYLLPMFPAFFVFGVGLIWRLPRMLSRLVCGAAAAGFIAAWFINPPYPFAYENNLTYADFIRLHQDAARALESRPAGERILTAWPATDELSRPFLGYVKRPLLTVPLQGFTESDFENVTPESFEIMYVYSRKWEPPGHWLQRFPFALQLQREYFDYAPQVPDQVLMGRYGLVLEKEFHRRGQWARIYARRSGNHPAPENRKASAPAGGR